MCPPDFPICVCGHEPALRELTRQGCPARRGRACGEPAGLLGAAAGGGEGMRLRKKRSRMTGGVIWIAVLAVLLAGVVALNVAVLRLNMRYDKLGRTKVELSAQNADLQSQLSSGAASQKIQQQARSQLGLVAANPDTTKYIKLNP